jgi:hypothetical protein
VGFNVGSKTLNEVGGEGINSPTHQTSRCWTVLSMGAFAPEKTREQRVRELNFSSHTGLSGVHRTATVHYPVHCQPNSYLSELAVGADRWRTRQFGAHRTTRCL